MARPNTAEPRTARSEVVVHGVVMDAKDDEAAAFYGGDPPSAGARPLWSQGAASASCQYAEIMIWLPMAYTMLSEATAPRSAGGPLHSSSPVDRE